MSTIYLYDGHTSPVADSPLVDVIKAPPSTPVEIGTSFPIRVPDDVSIPHEPTDVNDLVTMKLDALQRRSGLPNAIYEDFLVNPGVSVPTANFNPRLVGDRVSFTLYQNPGDVWMDAVSIGSPAPDIVRLDFDAFLYTIETDTVTGRCRRMLTDITEETYGGSEVNAIINFDGTQVTLDAKTFTILPNTHTIVDPANQGTNPSLGFQGALSGGRRNVVVGFWALFY